MQSSDRKLPVAETFTSIHGEGAYAGTPMTFFRLAGCTVGKYEQGLSPNPHFPLLPNGSSAATCTTFDGRKFPCDTDFHKSEVLTEEELLSRIPPNIHHVCITGGEPLMHQHLFNRLIPMIINKGITPHFETSGTIMPVGDWGHYDRIYYACSPKAKWLPQFVKSYAHEIRIMVDKDLESEAAENLIRAVPPGIPIFFSPLSSPNDVREFDEASLAMAMQYTTKYPGTRISIQMHKVLHVR